MKLGYVIVYVPNVSATVAFWERAFGLQRGFVHESGTYAELETGSTALAFVAESMIAETMKFRRMRPGDDPPGVEVGLVTDDVAAAWKRALEAGATPFVEPVVKPWGQTVAYVRDANGALVELCTPV